MLGNLHVRFGVGAGVKFPGLHHFILARQGHSYARLRFNVGPGGDVNLPVRVDYTRPFAASDHAAWQEEYLAAVQIAELPLFARRGADRLPSSAATLDPWDEDWFLAWDRPLQEAEPGFIERKEAPHVV